MHVSLAKAYITSKASSKDEKELNIDVVMNLLHEHNRILSHISERDYGHENGENSMISIIRLLMFDKKTDKSD